MANTIISTIETGKDGRNNLFLVGCAHAYKSRQGGFASSQHDKDAAMTAGAQLAEKLGDKNVFTIFQHVMAGDNSGGHRSLLRGGVFDKAFEAVGNRPVGFALAGTPFGNEPFDGIHEIKYNAATGRYTDNFDGYLFLHPLAAEPKAAPLTEIFTTDFVNEIKRRAILMGNQNNIRFWFGKTAAELTPEYITKVLTEE